MYIPCRCRNRKITEFRIISHVVNGIVYNQNPGKKLHPGTQKYNTKIQLSPTKVPGVGTQSDRWDQGTTGCKQAKI